MIKVTITFRASKSAYTRHSVLGAPLRLYDHRDYYVPMEEMSSLIELCRQRGWEIEASPVYTTSLEHIYGEVIESEWKEDRNG